jgi:hypothetical protein
MESRPHFTADQPAEQDRGNAHFIGFVYDKFRMVAAGKFDIVRAFKNPPLNLP